MTSIGKCRKNGSTCKCQSQHGFTPSCFFWRYPALYFPFQQWQLAAGSHSGGHGETAIGKPGEASKVTPTVVVDMTDDTRFHSSIFSAKQGETTRFIAKNSGKVKHELVLGTVKDLKDHYEVMKKNPETVHEDSSKSGGAILVTELQPAK